MIGARELAEFAPAKVNLFLHVGPPGGDGYHPLASLVAFADVGDRLTVSDCPTMEFDLTGAFAAGLDTGAGNLVVKARDLFIADARSEGSTFHLTLEKNLPLASGLGGGSSDGAATLRLLGRRFGIDGAYLMRLAHGLGADGPVCLAARALVVGGRGERLSPAPRLPVLHAVLVNPGIACSTAAVFGQFNGEPGAGADMPRLPSAFSTPAEVAAFLATCRNDLECAATTVAPVIGAVLDALGAHPASLLARMSGSGATCFALCRNGASAGVLAHAVARAHPDWWVRRCTFDGGFDSPGPLRPARPRRAD